MQHSKFIYEHGVPDKVVTDRGTNLVKAGQTLAKNEGPGSWDGQRSRGIILPAPGNLFL